MSQFPHTKLAAVLTNLANEHGLPNNFPVKEIVECHWRAPSPQAAAMLIGRMVRFERPYLNNLLEGIEIATYSRGAGGRMVIGLAKAEGR